MADDPLTGENEEWRDIPEWAGYQVSNLGRVRSLPKTHRQRSSRNPSSFADYYYPGRVRAQSLCARTGYFRVNLRIAGEKRKTCAVHALVCAAFHGPRSGQGLVVAHCNGIRTDNRSSNLRWASQRENMADREIHGTVNRGERNGQAKITDAQFEHMKVLRHKGASARDLALRFGICERHVFFRLSGKKRTRNSGKTEEQRE